MMNYGNPPQTIGPFNSTSSPALVAGTALEFSVNNQAVAIQVHNDSPYRCYIAFDGARPSSTVAQLGTYQGVAGPWAHPVILVRPQYSQFQGNVWLMPVDVTAPLAQTGSVSQLAEIHVDVFMPGDVLPQSWSMPRQQDVTSQPRTVVVPTSLAHFYNNAWNGVGTSLVATLVPNATQLDAGFAPIYLYYAHMTPGAAASGVTVFAIQTDYRNSGGTSITTTELTRGMVAYDTTTHGMFDWAFAPTWPYGLVGPLPANTATVRVNLVNLSGTPIALNFTIAISMDFVNITGTPEIGQTPFNAASQPRF